MRNNIFTKVLYEKRRSIALWALIIAVANIAVALLFPAIRDTMGSLAESSIPAGMENWFGEAATWQTYTGYAGQELFGQMSIILVIMAVLFGSSFLAGYEGNGTLLTLLSRPISRQRVYWQKYAAFVVALAVASVAFFAGIVAGGWILGEPVSYQVFASCTLMIFLLCLTLGSVAYAIGAITGKRGTVGIIVGLYTFVAYLLFSLSTAADIVDKLSYASLFRYTSAPEVIANGLNFGHIALLLLTTVAFAITGVTVFKKRDLKTR